MSDGGGRRGRGGNKNSRKRFISSSSSLAHFLTESTVEHRRSGASLRSSSQTSAPTAKKTNAEYRTTTTTTASLATASLASARPPVPQPAAKQSLLSASSGALPMRVLPSLQSPLSTSAIAVASPLLSATSIISPPTPIAPPTPTAPPTPAVVETVLPPLQLPVADSKVEQADQAERKEASGGNALAQSAPSTFHLSLPPPLPQPQQKQAHEAQEKQTIPMPMPIPSPSTFVVLTHTHRPRTVFFIRVQGNEEFLHGSRGDPNGGLLRALDNAQSVVIGQRYFLLETAKSLLQRDVLQQIGFAGRIFDVLITTRWTVRLWDECKRSLIALLDRIASSTSSAVAPSSLQPGTGIISSAHLPPNVSRRVQELQERNQDAICTLYTFHFRHFCSWLATTVLDEFRSELVPRLPFLVFQHCYFDLLMHSSSENAALFFQRHASLFDRTGGTQTSLFDRTDTTTYSRRGKAAAYETTSALPGSSVIFVGNNNNKPDLDDSATGAFYSHDSETAEKLRTMRHIQTREQMAESDICRHLRLRRCSAASNQYTMQPLAQTFYVSAECYDFLQHNITVMLMPKIATVMRTYINFAVLPATAAKRSRDVFQSSQPSAPTKRARVGSLEGKDYIVVENFDRFDRRSFASRGSGASLSFSTEFACRAVQLEHTLDFAAKCRAQMEALERKYAHLIEAQKQ